MLYAGKRITDSTDKSTHLDLEARHVQVLKGPLYCEHECQMPSISVSGKANIHSLHVKDECKFSGPATMASTRHLGLASFPAGFKCSNFSVDGADGAMRCGSGISMTPKTGAMEAHEVHTKLLVLDGVNLTKEMQELKQQLSEMHMQLRSAHTLIERLEHDIYGAADILDYMPEDELQ